MRRLSWIITIPLLVIAVVFAVVNRQPVAVQLWPFEITLQAPLFLVVLLAIFVGFVLGGIASWLAAGRKRRAQRDERERLRRLEHEVETLRRSRGQPALPASTGH
ncbi:LapA family protein [Aquibaculum arenosum]|uniref:LapA family protein n=1 Tax=Aquibaculum arenosum TaxID=3032591 RepID=A0ABT5YIB5_9PROT|nr:LapA family protein [Fodinicurvata sp. CAU 1616]MDF2094663.1 LapA family protein [Fodinicurvata sp. CAU 1616]